MFYRLLAPSDVIQLKQRPKNLPTSHSFFLVLVLWVLVDTGISITNKRRLFLHRQRAHLTPKTLLISSCGRLYLIIITHPSICIYMPNSGAFLMRCLTRFIFELPNNEASLLPITSCVLVRASNPDHLKDAKGNPIIRPYTPISPSDAKGEFTFLVKRYETGNASKYFFTLSVCTKTPLIRVEHVHTSACSPGTRWASRGPFPSFPTRVWYSLLHNICGLTTLSCSQ